MPHRVVAREALADFLAVLGHPLRIGLILALAEDERDVSWLADKVGASQATVSAALGRLRAAHIVLDRREGRHVFYRLTSPTLARWLIDGLALVEQETAQVGAVHDAVAQARRALDGEGR